MFNKNIYLFLLPFLPAESSEILALLAALFTFRFPSDGFNILSTMLIFFVFSSLIPLFGATASF